MTYPWTPVRTAYDTVAENYAEMVRVADVETGLDAAMLEEFATRVRGRGRVLDAGCGPGRMARHLADLGVEVFGIDLSPEMVRIARDRHPDLAFAEGSIDGLDVRTRSLAGVLAWYSIIHTRPADLPTVISEFLRVLEPGGWLLTGCQSGDGSRHLAHAYGHDLDLMAHLYTTEHLTELIEERGGRVHARLTVGPEGTQKHPQAFVLARRTEGVGGS